MDAVSINLILGGQRQHTGFLTNETQTSNYIHVHVRGHWKNILLLTIKLLSRTQIKTLAKHNLMTQTILISKRYRKIHMIVANGKKPTLNKERCGPQSKSAPHDHENDECRRCVLLQNRKEAIF